MATVFKRKGRGPYIIQYFDHNGRRREKSSRTTDKKTAKRVAAKIEADVALRREGVIDPKADAFAQAERRPITDHVEDFINCLAARGVTDRQVMHVRKRVQRIITLCHSECTRDLRGSKVQGAIGVLRGQGASIQTCNHALRAVKQFTRWLLEDGRISADPIRHLKMGNAETDRRYVRRALTTVELQRLIMAAETGRECCGMSGSDRAMLYRVAAGTGFRSSELATLTVESFQLDGDRPTVTIEAAYSKRRKRDVQPIQKYLADLLKSWLADKAGRRPVFKLPWKTARMLRIDLKAAGIPSANSAGEIVDFHALRHTYITMLADSNASVKVVQELARHSTPLLTIGRYTHTNDEGVNKALSALPVWKPDVAQARAQLPETEVHKQTTHHSDR